MIFLMFATSCLSIALSGQKKINWLEWEEALELSRTSNKKMIVDVITPWCGWCKKMDASTFSTPHVIDYINENYIAVKFNAEISEDIIFNNKVYKLITGFGRRKYHELAFEIMNGKISYPTIVFLDESLDVIQPLPGFKSAKDMELILNFFAGNHYLNTPWQKFAQAFKSPNYPKGKAVTPASIQPNVQTVGNQ